MKVRVIVCSGQFTWYSQEQPGQERRIRYLIDGRHAKSKKGPVGPATPVPFAMFETGGI